MDDVNTTSEIHFNSGDSSDYYEYIVIADDGYDIVNVANIPNYVPYYISIIFAIGILSGLIFGWLSSWRR